MHTIFQLKEKLLSLPLLCYCLFPNSSSSGSHSILTDLPPHPQKTKQNGRKSACHFLLQKAGTVILSKYGQVCGEQEQSHAELCGLLQTSVQVPAMASPGGPQSTAPLLLGLSELGNAGTGRTWF